jgi:hypothetical protein
MRRGNLIKKGDVFPRTVRILDSGFHRNDKREIAAPPCQINHTLVFVVRTFRCTGLTGLKTRTTFWFHPLNPPASGGSGGNFYCRDRSPNDPSGAFWETRPTSLSHYEPHPMRRGNLMSLRDCHGCRKSSPMIKKDWITAFAGMTEDTGLPRLPRVASQ